MFLRLLIHLNAADWQEELEKSGVSDKKNAISKSDLTAETVVLKIVDADTATLSQIREWLTVLAPDAVFGNADCAIFLRLGNPPAKYLSQIADSLPKTAAHFRTEIMQIVNGFSKREWEFTLPHGKTLMIDRPLIMGILNVTPDSFSDGGQHNSGESAVRRARQMLDEGADIIDIGGESTRPGAGAVSAADEWQRIGPVIQQLANLPGCIISVDTYKSDVAKRALENGAHIINDISGARFDPAIADVAAAFNAPMALMHIQGEPRTMQHQPNYHLLMEDICRELKKSCEFVRSRGVMQILLDPGIGFGKTVEHNLEILRRLRELRIFGHPVLLGTSRKSFIGRVLDESVEDRLTGTIISNVVGINNGAAVLRVHDVHQHRNALKLIHEIKIRKCP